MGFKITSIVLFSFTAFLVLYSIPIIYNYSTTKVTPHGRKFNERGEYLPFYGYTSLAFLEKDAQPLCKSIEEFIKSSSLKNYFSALPAWTYHMTIFSIYVISRQPIPPVQRWMNETKEELPEFGWLPEEVLKTQHSRAAIVLEKVSKSSHIIAVEPWGKNSIAIRLKLDEKSDEELQAVRKSLAEIYEHPDIPLRGEGNSINWHIGLAYRFKELPAENSKESVEVSNDLKTVMTLASGIPKYTLVNHDIYFYNSMTNFMPVPFIHPSNAVDFV